MSCVSIHDLAIFTGGHLRLGVLPPLGGVMEPIRRIRTDLEQLQAGDIFWQFGQSPQIHEAFARGAMGIVHEGPRMEPWAGRFTLQVRSAEHALHLAAIRSRKEYAGWLIALECLGDCPCACRAGREFVRRLGQWVPSAVQFEPTVEADMAREIIHLDERRPYSVFNLYRQSVTARRSCLERFAANVIVTSRRGANYLPASKARLIYCDDFATVREMAQAAWEATGNTNQTGPCVALPSMPDLRESGMPTLLGRSNELADRWLLGRSPWQVLPGRA